MSGLGSIGSVGNFDFLRIYSLGKTRSLDSFAPTTSRDQDLRQLLNQVKDLRRSLERWSEVTRFGYLSSASGGTAVSARSSSDLSLADTATPAELRSTEEINTTPTSYLPLGPDFAGASDTLATIGGVYDGSLGDTTLTFDIKKGGVVGTDNVILDVLDGGSKIDSVVFNGAAGDTLSTVGGLTVTLSAGTAVINDSFQVDISATIGTTPNVDGSFDGVRNDDPRLDAGQSVTTGSFEINGVSISVSSSDSLTDVLTRITASSAGVQANYDSLTESVVLQQKTAGATSTITLGADDSGFFDAYKLTGAPVSPGANGATDQVIEDVPSLSGISSGHFSINGTSLTIDVSADTLQAVIDQINGAGLGVTANYDDASDRVTVQSNDPEANLVLEDGTSNFFSGLAITAQTYEPEAGTENSTRTVLSKRRSFERQLEEVAQELKVLFGTAYFGPASSLAQGARSQIEEVVRDAFDRALGIDGDKVLRSGLGLDFAFDGTDRVLRFDGNAFSKGLRSDGAELRSLFEGSGPDNSKGLADALIEATGKLEGQLRESLNLDPDVGRNVDTLA